MLQSIFRENRPAFANLADIAKGAVTLDPAERNAKTINPHESIASFEASEQDAAEKAWGKPVQDLLQSTRSQISNLLQSIVELPQAALDIVTKPIGRAFQAGSNLIARIVETPLKIATTAVLTPVAIIGNIQKYITDMGIKIPFSVLNITGSYAGKPGLKLSQGAKMAKEAIEAKSTAAGDTIRNTGESIRKKIQGLKVPGMKALEDWIGGDAALAPA